MPSGFVGAAGMGGPATIGVAGVVVGGAARSTTCADRSLAEATAPARRRRLGGRSQAPADVAGGRRVGRRRGSGEDRAVGTGGIAALPAPAAPLPRRRLRRWRSADGRPSGCPPAARRACAASARDGSDSSNSAAASTMPPATVLGRPATAAGGRRRASRRAPERRSRPAGLQMPARRPRRRTASPSRCRPSTQPAPRTYENTVPGRRRCRRSSRRSSRSRRARRGCRWRRRRRRSGTGPRTGSRDRPPRGLLRRSDSGLVLAVAGGDDEEGLGVRRDRVRHRRVLPMPLSEALTTRAP